MSDANSTGSEPIFDRGEWIHAVDEDRSTVSVSSFRNTKKKLNREKTYVVRLREGSSSPVAIGYFPTNLTPGRRIRHAITGFYTEHIVGSLDEHLYFSVLNVTGETGQTPECAFYDNPEQYERHMHVELNDMVKDVWRNKYNVMLQNRQDSLLAAK